MSNPLTEAELKALTQLRDELAIAKLTRKQINDLPDAAFAVIESGGRSDEEGKTIPRQLRHLPHHTRNVKNGNEHSSIDKNLLRAALARVNQILAAGPKENTQSLRKRALAHLKRHARAVFETTQSK